MATLPDSNTNDTNDTRNKNSKNNTDATHAQEPKHTNKLIDEQSPYLLQHAHNPVDWYPWGQEAFDKAVSENKPIFLSVGYSTCHWCHVMEHESFEKEEVASIMNNNFICIKVDREERPDVDKMYMTYVQASSGHGGWPMSVWLTPTLKPIFGGTYFPREDGMYGQVGFKSILNRLATLWKEKHEEIEVQSDRIINVLKNAMMQTEDVVAPSEEKKNNEITLQSGDEIIESLYKHFNKTFDDQLGGFGGAPKFPRPSEMNSLLRYYYRHPTTENGQLALAMVLKTLKYMGNGGMFDHLGGGFHRYSVDEYWHVPHFEKMLYDNAQLIVTYLNAYQITKDAFYKDIASQCLEYIMRDMTDPDCKGIWSAEDADSWDVNKTEKKEGLFYIWSEDEIDRLLGGKDSSESILFKYMYFIKKNGNATLSRRSDPHLEFHGQNILYKRYNLEETLEYIKSKHERLYDSGKGEIGSIDDIRYCLESAKEKLFNYRNNNNVKNGNKDGLNRYKPHCDDKIIVAWNGLMISAFAKAHQVIEIAGNIKEEENADSENSEIYLNRGKDVALFIYNRMRNVETGHLYRIYRNGVCNKKIEGFSSDYSYLIQGLLDLYEASFDLFYLQWAIELQTIEIALFYDFKDDSSTNVTDIQSILLNNATSNEENENKMNDNNNDPSKRRIFGGFYESLANDKNLLIRSKEDYDGAEPSSTSIAINNMLRLYKMTNNDDYLKYSTQSLKTFLKRMREQPFALPQCIVSLDSYVRPFKQIIFTVYDGSMSDTLEIENDKNESKQNSDEKEEKSLNNVGSNSNGSDLCKDNDKLQEYCKIIFGNFYPDSVLIALNSENRLDLVNINDELKWFDCSVIPTNIKNESNANGETVERNDVFVNVCDQFRCNAPTNKASELERLIEIEVTTFDR